MVADGAYYARMLESLYSAVEGLDATGYAYAAADGTHTDGWSQGRFADGQRGGSAHLECWIDLGGINDIGRSHIRHSAAIVFACRYVPDNDSVAQARMQAATRAIVDLLVGWSMPSGERTTPTGSTIEILSAEWVAVTVNFNLQLPRD